jgi:hypothetical protein
VFRVSVDHVASTPASNGHQATLGTTCREPPGRRCVP